MTSSPASSWVQLPRCSRARHGSALEVHIFPERAARGTGEEHPPWEVAAVEHDQRDVVVDTVSKMDGRHP